MTTLRVKVPDEILRGVGLNDLSTLLPAGAARIGSASYPIPGGTVLYVSPSGSDSSGDGSLNGPYRTLKQAAATAPAGSTIVMREGEYHEGGLYPSLGSGPVVKNTSVTIQNYPGEAVWLDGSVPVSGWSAYGSGKWRVPFALTLDRAPTQSKGEKLSSYGSFVVAQFPIAHWPELLLIDGVAMQQVQTLDEVGPGTFFVEGTYPNASGVDANAFRSTAYVIGDNPAGKEVRISNLARAIGTNVANTTIRGIGIRRYCAALCDFGAIYTQGQATKFENVIIQHISDQAISANYSVGLTLQRCTIDWCGRSGVGTLGTDNFLFEYNLVTRTNVKRFNYGPDGGGIKMNRVWDGIIRYNRFDDNRGHGIWFDQSCYRAKVHGNWFTNTYGAGVLYEISARGIIVDNIFIDNGIMSTDMPSDRLPHNDSAIKIISSKNCVVWHNTVINAEVPMSLSEGYRKPLNDDGQSWRTSMVAHDGTTKPVFAQDKNRTNAFYQAQGFADVWDFYRTEMSWDTESLSFGNNAFVGAAGISAVQSCFISFYDENRKKSTVQLGGPLNLPNLYVRSGASNPGRFANGWKITAIGSSGTTIAYFNRTSAASDGSASWETIQDDVLAVLLTSSSGVVNKPAGRLSSTILDACTPAAVPTVVAQLRAASPFTPQRVGAGYAKGI